mgnify:CR=1 FL=1
MLLILPAVPSAASTGGTVVVVAANTVRVGISKFARLRILKISARNSRWPCSPNQPNVVSYWNDIANKTVLATAKVSTTPEEQRPAFFHDVASVQVAIYDAVVAIEGGYKPFAIKPGAPAAGASVDAAVSAAAYGVLKALFPNRNEVYQAAYDQRLAAIPNGQAKTLGIALGSEVAAGVVRLTGWGWVDPLAGVAIGVWILPRTFRLGLQAVRILLQAAPTHIDLHRLQSDLCAIDGVVDVHDLHVWTLTSDMEAASAHLMTSDGADAHGVLDQARQLLAERYGIGHGTFQVEPESHLGCRELTW